MIEKYELVTTIFISNFFFSDITGIKYHGFCWQIHRNLLKIINEKTISNIDTVYFFFRRQSYLKFIISYYFKY